MIKRWISIVIVIFLIVTNVPQYAFADSLDTWTLKSPLPTSNLLNSVTYGNGKFVSVGTNGTILTSSDGANWTSRASGFTTILNGIAYGSGIFVAVGNSGKIVTSIDGLNWTTQTSGTTNFLYGVVYGNGMFVAVGDTGTILTSPNGTDWTLQSNSSPYNLNAVTYGNGKYVAVGNNGKIITSVNGTSWSSQTSNTTNALFGVSYGNNSYVAVGLTGTIVTSSNGTSWTGKTSDSKTLLTGIAYVNGMYAAVDYDGLIVTSVDGESWTSRTSGITGRLYGMAYGNGTYVAVGVTTLTSSNGVSWTNRAIGPRSHLYGEIYANGMYVAVGFSGAIETSNDGANWTSRASGTTNLLGGVTYGNGTYVAVGNAGTILTSSDGLSWTSQTSGTTNSLKGVTYGDGTFMAVGEMGLILTSRDGLQWTSQTSGTTNFLFSVTYGSGMFVAVGDSGRILTSTDGSSWTIQTSGTANYLYGVTYGNSMYVAVGGTGTIVTSSNGVNWTSRTSGSSNLLYGATYGNGTYAVAGYSGTIVASSDGVNWTSRTSGTANNLMGVAFGNGTYVVVGMSGTVVQSAIITAAPAINSVSISPATASIAQGGSKQFTANVDAVGGAATTVTWKTNDPKLTVDSDGNVTVPADTEPGTYIVTATSTFDTSKKSNATITVTLALAAESTPAARIDYREEQLTGLLPNGTYTINGTAVTADGSGKIAIDGSWLGATVNVVKTGNGTTTADSVAQVLSLPARIAAPVDISVTDTTYNGANNGSILNVNLAMEFKKGNTGTWTNTTGTSVVGLAPGVYYVRLAATESDFASIPAQVTIHNSDATLPGAPNVSADDVSNVIVGLDTTMEFSVDGRAYVRYDGTNMPELSGEHTVQVRVAASGSVPAGPPATLIFTTNVSTPAEQPASQPSTGTAGPKEEAVDVLINGKVENAGKATTTESGGIKTTTVVVDPVKLQTKLDAEGVNAVVTIPVKSASNVIVGELNGQMIKNMENLSATLVLQTGKGTYTLPAKEINIDELASKLGSSVKLEDIQLKVTVAQTPDTMAKVVENAASKGEFSVVAPALDFTVTATYGGKTVEITTFNVYVERMVALPEGIDLNRITTGVVIDADGTVRHVPTKIVTIDGKSYAKINSLTNSTYTVVWHPIAFADVEKHWAKEAVNDMGSRLVIHGVNEATFNPDADITRAEFVAIIVRGLGLRLGEGSQSFGDVATDAWYASAIQTAVANGLVSGFEDGSFHPNAKITREQAMVIIAKAMKLTGLAKATGAIDTNSVLGKFADSSGAGTWARDSIALAAKAGLISGRNGGKLEARANVTRAEVATLIQRLLKQSNLI